MWGAFRAVVSFSGIVYTPMLTLDMENNAMKLKKLSLFVAAVLILLGGVIQFGPELATTYHQSESRDNANLTLKTVEVDGYTIPFLEGGEGKESILMIHGFGASKDSWVSLSAELVQKYHIIVPDLPGFGEATYKNRIAMDF